MKVGHANLQAAIMMTGRHAMTDSFANLQATIIHYTPYGKSWKVSASRVSYSGNQVQRGEQPSANRVAAHKELGGRMPDKI